MRSRSSLIGEREIYILMVMLVMAGFLFQVFSSDNLAGEAYRRARSVECRDGLDNDGDRMTDLGDPGCSNWYDGDESNCGDLVCEGGETCEDCPGDCSCFIPLPGPLCPTPMCAAPPKGCYYQSSTALGSDGCPLYPCGKLVCEEGFVLVGTHPYASEQSTRQGKELRGMTAWKGLLYLGYGDFGSNTGPITIAPFNPRTETFEHQFDMSTESVDIFRPIGDKLYVPSTDPRGGADYALGVPWSEKDVIQDSAHVFDVATLDGNDLWLAGSKMDSSAAVWHSVDGGDTWSLSLEVPPRKLYSNDDFARFYFIASYKGRLYVQADDQYGPPHPESWVYDGDEWAEGVSLYSSCTSDRVYKPMVFSGRLVYLCGSQLVPYPSQLLSFDGNIVVRVISPNVYDFTVYDDTLYAVLPDPRIVYTRDLRSWKELHAPPSGSTTIEVIDGVLYVGTSSSELYRYDGSITGPDTVCGNGLVEGYEQCDGSDFAGRTCVSEGFSGGRLTCVDCVVRTSRCYG